MIHVVLVIRMSHNLISLFHILDTISACPVSRESHFLLPTTYLFIILLFILISAQRTNKNTSAAQKMPLSFVCYVFVYLALSIDTNQRLTRDAKSWFSPLCGIVAPSPLHLPRSQWTHSFTVNFNIYGIVIQQLLYNTAHISIIFFHITKNLGMYGPNINFN